MKKKYRFRLSLLLFITFTSFAVAQTSLGTTKSFMNNLKKGLVTSETSKTTLKTVLLEAENLKKFNAIINYKDSNASSELLIGEIKNIEESSFYIKVMDNSLEGHILFKKTKEAYKYYSDANGNAFVSKVDINTLICIDYNNVSENTNKATRKVTAVKISPALLNLQSLPGAAGCILLDYDGYYMPAGNYWNSGNAIDAAPSNLSDEEIKRSYEIVAEDYRPFNLNVTTNEAVFNSYPKNRRMRVVITPTNITTTNAGGVAYVGSFNWDNDVPCWVFMKSSKDAGEAASHEIGHTFDLGHDGLTNNDSPYYYGLTNTSWAPIMGVGYGKPIVQWSKGEYANADNKQDDVATIAGTKFGIGYRADDYGNSIASASNLDYNASGVINQKNGIISSQTDSDFFTFTTLGGNVSINADTLQEDGNLHLLMKLYNAAGVEMKTYWNQDPFFLNTTMNVNLPAGKYFIRIRGTGAGDPLSGGYSAYGSIGSYSITGTIGAGLTISPSTDVVTVYEDFNYSGFSGGLTIGDYDTERLNSLGILDDDISSLKVAQGFQVILYQEDNFTGASIVINFDTGSLNRAWNDKVSSVRVLANGVTTLDNQTFYLRNKNSGLSMEISRVNYKDIVQGNLSNNYRQYKFYHLGDGLYIIAGGETLTVNGSNSGNGANLVDSPYLGGANQQFIVVATEDGFYKFIARHSGKVVEVAGASMQSGAKIQQWDNVNQTCGQWKLVSTIVPEDAIFIQAEDYSSMKGITTEATTDVGGGLNVTNTDVGDSLKYNNISFPTTGSYLIEYRVASAVDGAQIFTYINDENIFLGNVNIPNTGGWQDWQIVTQTVDVNAGTYNFNIYVQNKSMNINWIRITKITSQESTLIQAEDYSSMKGITTEVTTDVGGGLNVTNTNIGDSLTYNNIIFPTTGSYLIEYRVASAVNEAQIFTYLNDENIFLGNVNIPNTGGWQNWQTVKQTVKVNAGNTNLYIYIQNKSMNINWIRISKIEAETSALIQAEDYSVMKGIATEATTDVGGGLNITDAETGDSLMYDNINFPSSGTYLIEYRVASLGGGRMLSYLNDEKILLGEVKTPNTRGLQNWQTVAQTVEVNEGTTNLFLYIQAGPLNINWIRITKIDDAALTPVASAIIAPQEIEDVALLYPNPVTDVLFFTKDVKGGNVSVVDSQTGNVVLSQKIDDNSLNVSSLNRGIYFIIFDVDGKQIVKRFIKK